MDAIYSRRSIRKFLKKDVPVELINDIIDAGRFAPSAKNRQPWRFIVFGNESKQILLDCMDCGIKREENGIAMLPDSSSGLPDARNTLKIMREAPIIIVVLNTNGKSPFLPVNSDDRITEICDSLSIGACIENILLKADESGIGTLWIANTCFAYKELSNHLKTENQIIGAIAVGYADEAPRQRPRKPLEAIVEYKL